MEALAGGRDVAEHVGVLEAVDGQAGDGGFAISYSVTEKHPRHRLGGAGQIQVLPKLWTLDLCTCQLDYLRRGVQPTI